MTGLLQWIYFIIAPLAEAVVALLVWSRRERMSFAVIAGALAGAALSLGRSAMFQNDVDAYQPFTSEGAQ